MAFIADHLAHQSEQFQLVVGQGNLAEVTAGCRGRHLFLQFFGGTAFSGQFSQERSVYFVSGNVGYEVTHGHLGKLANHPNVSGPFEPSGNAPF